MKLPQDPNILLSMINMKLRDKYNNLDALCEDLEINHKEIEVLLAANGYTYSPAVNQFRAN